ncbi:MAG: glycine/sarcosine/betaine reductase complex component C subunit beta [Eubacteriales bacterium]|nr:glycine/sarcosine/betaine reductase complex component C subunit beta [Eubacteriales bacterium]MDD4389910.1 glycine/sarcosine/betaine reductase complex component C subunit beta [Eubacteriales bacterium]
MSGYAVLKGTAYTLAAAQDMVLYNGTTQTTERIVNPGSEYLTALPKHLRSFEEIVSYIPNQVYIGNASPDVLEGLALPWHDKRLPNSDELGTKGKFGEIISQDMFIGLMAISDAFDLVKLERSFAEQVREKLAKHELIGEEKSAPIAKNQESIEIITELVEKEHAEAIYFNGALVGAVKRAHDVDINLSAHVMLENLATKASSVFSLLCLLRSTGIDPGDVDYVIDCCEEACGDMNQRGGGNFAKAAAEIAGLHNATGSDVRGFCAAPAHAILSAASLVKAGTFKNVVVTAGGCTAKLGMNGRDHVKKGLPILEDVISGFSVLISENDGVSPVIRNDITGRHTVGTGSSPQAVISSLVTNALESKGLKITDIDKYSPEMQNPDITKPAGAGDVPESNYKMIAALAVKKGEIERTEIADFVKKHGMQGWAPTQGHIPSGVPYLGFAKDDIMAGKINKAMIIGKGSLFLGRMTNLFDGVSFVLEANSGETEGAKASDFDEKKVKGLIANAMKQLADSIMKE